MAAIDPLEILNQETQVGPDGVARRANEKVTRNYMQFGKYSLPLQIQNVKFLSVLRFGDKDQEIPAPQKWVCIATRTLTKHLEWKSQNRDKVRSIIE